MKRALIIGGTKGLGLSLAWGTYERDIIPVITGRSTWENSINFPPIVEYFELDLTDPASFKSLSVLKRKPLDYVFWVAGNFTRQRFVEMVPGRVSEMVSVHLSGPVNVLQALHSEAIDLRQPYHLVTIASTSSWRMRENETLYCALKAAKAAFTRNFAQELVRDLPGSKVTLVNPGGIKTPNFWARSSQDISKFMEPDVVARVIWDQVQRQAKLFEEMQIMRNDDGTPNVSFGPHLPELPF